MKYIGQTALSRQTDVAIFALPIIVTSEEVCDPSASLRTSCHAFCCHERRTVKRAWQQKLHAYLQLG